MIYLPLIPAGVLVAWLWLLLFRIGRHWICRCPKAETSLLAPQGISVIIPARNEEQRLPKVLDALAKAREGIFEIIIINDASTDNTQAAAEAAAKNDSRIRTPPCPQLPDDWRGKTWALWQGAQSATGKCLLFMDADVVFSPELVLEAARILEERGLDALSLIPRMPAQNFGAAILTACMAVARAILMTPAKVGRPGVVQGAFFLVRRAAYDAVGGHAAVRQSLLEDMEFGGLLQNAGFAVESCHGRPLLATRMYETFHEAWEGFKKHIFAMAGFSLARAGMGVLLLMLLVLLPFASLSAGAFLPMPDAEVDPAVHNFFLWFLPATAAMYAGIICVTLAEGLPLAAGLFTPLTFFLCAGLLLQSIWGYRRGVIRWKGRAYKPGGAGRKQQSGAKQSLRNERP